MDFVCKLGDSVRHESIYLFGHPFKNISQLSLKSSTFGKGSPLIRSGDVDAVKLFKDDIRFIHDKGQIFKIYWKESSCQVTKQALAVEYKVECGSCLPCIAANLGYLVGNSSVPSSSSVISLDDFPIYITDFMGANHYLDPLRANHTSNKRVQCHFTVHTYIMPLTWESLH